MSSGYGFRERLYRSDYEKLKAHGRIASNMTITQYIDQERERTAKAIESVSAATSNTTVLERRAADACLACPTPSTSISPSSAADTSTSTSPGPGLAIRSLANLGRVPGARLGENSLQRDLRETTEKTGNTYYLSLLKEKESRARNVTQTPQTQSTSDDLFSWEKEAQESMANKERAEAAAARQTESTPSPSMAPSLLYRASAPTVSDAPKTGPSAYSAAAQPNTSSETSASTRIETNIPPITYDPPKIEPPIPGIPEAEIRASRYWGKVISQTGISPRLNSCVVAVCDIAMAVSSARPPAVPLEKAAVYLMPETFSTVLTLFEIQEPEFGPPEIVEDYGPSHFDDIFAQYYLAFDLPIVWATRPGSNRPNNLPLIKRQSVKLWLRNYIMAQPDELHKRLNTLLRDVPELQHPMEDKPFIHKEVPRGCFPAEFDLAANRATVKAFAQFKAASMNIIDRAQPVQTLENARQDYTNAVEQARAQKEYFLNLNGGWTKDEYGNDKYVEGSRGPDVSAN
ncbi:hypothetical protein G7Y89_g12584 [Cudoniella acicularis]|uniref:DUF7514 domain-containing protein n=1 Tax=Cudoniella acicularis TaxID=354080 RepID=A0A8H4RB90_9HELO|nr:hypothetical protein G7Y89_g12584 [Cudoniella acicularis]